jgi:hypothetical protein
VEEICQLKIPMTLSGIKTAVPQTSAPLEAQISLSKKLSRHGITKLKTGKRVQHTELTGTSPLLRQWPSLDCSAI